jgi:hypothetical protein
VNQGYLPAPSRGGADALASNFGFRLPFQQDYHLPSTSPSTSITKSPPKPHYGPHGSKTGPLRAAVAVPRVLLDARALQYPYGSGGHSHFHAHPGQTRRAWVSNTPMEIRSTE